MGLDDAAEGFLGAVEEAAHGFRVAHVGLHGNGAAACCLDVALLSDWLERIAKGR